MKKVFTPLRILVLGLILGSVQVQAQTVSAEMKAFLGMFNGTDEAAEAAVNKYGSDEVKENGTLPYGKSPTVISTEGSCYTVRFDDEGANNDYVICWKNGKIISLDWAEDESDDGSGWDFEEGE